MSDKLEGTSKFLDISENRSGHELALLKNVEVEDKPKTSKFNDTSQEHKIQPHISVDYSETGFIRLIVSECKNISDGVAFFNTPQIDANLFNNLEVLFLKFVINDTNTELDSNTLFLLSTKYCKNSIVLKISSSKTENFSLYWKSKEIRSFLVFTSYSDSKTEFKALLNYIEEFLRKSLIKKHLGLFSYVTAQNQLKKIELHLLADYRDFNLLLLAAEEGKDHIVKNLLKLGISSDSSFKNINAQSLAYKNRHFHVLLLLLQSNLTYPEGMNINECSDEIKEFHGLSCKLHGLIVGNNKADVTEILDQNPQLRYFYNHKNESAAAIALRDKNVEMYKILTKHEVFLGPHEDTEEIMENLEYDQRRDLRELHHEHLQDLPEKHLNVLMSKSFVGHDVPDAKRKVGLFHRAFNVLNGIDLIRILLMVVAASKKFQIIFDFNRDSVQLVDPTATSLTAGVFYLSGRIYIGAKQLLLKLSESEALATIAHEFCHFAVNLTYNNDAKPYFKNDFQSMQEFEEISQHCQQHMDKEEVIQLVYSCYSIETHHAELIVRVPHLLALYINQPEKLKEVSKIFKPLFDFYGQRVVPEMEKALPNIEESAEKEIEEKDKKISKLIKILIILGILSIFGIFMAGYIFHKPTYSFTSLSENDKIKVKDSLVYYMGENVKFADLFPKNSTAFNELNPSEIAIILSDKKLNLSDPHLNYLNSFIYHNWGNLTEKLKQKFLNSNFTFQNESVRYRDLFLIKSNVFGALTSNEIKQGLKGIKLEVGQGLQNDTLFYIERYFKKSGIFLDNINDYYDYEDEISTILTNLDQYSSYNSYHEEISNISEVISNTQESKLFILSSEAGTGKTVTFKQLSWEIKKFFPMQWVSYIDLKSNTKYFNPNGTVEDVEKLLKSILNLSIKSEFEKTIFEEFYKIGSVTILWNGFDEISPLYSNFTLNVVSIIQNNTMNIQYICTRPL